MASLPADLFVKFPIDECSILNLKALLGDDFVDIDSKYTWGLTREEEIKLDNIAEKFAYYGYRCIWNISLRKVKHPGKIFGEINTLCYLLAGWRGYPLVPLEKEFFFKSIYPSDVIKEANKVINEIESKGLANIDGYQYFGSATYDQE